MVLLRAYGSTVRHADTVSCAARQAVGWRASFTSLLLLMHRALHHDAFLHLQRRHLHDFVALGYLHEDAPRENQVDECLLDLVFGVRCVQIPGTASLRWSAKACRGVP